MRILNRLGGIELSQAYATIKAISKKKAEVIAQSREQFIAGADRAGAGPRQGRQDLRPDRALRRLRLQQVAQHGLCPGRLSDGLPEGPLPDRVHGGPALLRDGRRRAGEVLRRAYRRLPADGDRGAAAQHQRGAVDFRVASEGKIHFGLGAIKGVGFKAVEAIVKARESERAVPEPRRLLRARLRQGGRPGCVETLIKAGAFDCLDARKPNLLRSQLLPSCPAPSRPGRPSKTTGAAASAASSTSSTRPATTATRNGTAAGRAEPARRPRAVRRRAPGRGEEGARLLHVEPSADPPRGIAPGPGDPPGRRPGRPSPRRRRSSWAA